MKSMITWGFSTEEAPGMRSCWIFVKEKYPEQADVMRELLTYDYYLRENAKSRPEFAGEDATDKRFVRAFYEEEEKRTKAFAGI